MRPRAEGAAEDLDVASAHALGQLGQLGELLVGEVFGVEAEDGEARLSVRVREPATHSQPLSTPLGQQGREAYVITESKRLSMAASRSCLRFVAPMRIDCLGPSMPSMRCRRIDSIRRDVSCDSPPEREEA